MEGTWGKWTEDIGGGERRGGRRIPDRQRFGYHVAQQALSQRVLRTGTWSRLVLDCSPVRGCVEN